MYEESVITPAQQVNEIFYVVPKTLEDQFVDLDCDTPKYEYARLDLMLEIINGYKSMADHLPDFKTARFHFQRGGQDKGILAKVIPIGKLED